MKNSEFQGKVLEREIPSGLGWIATDVFRGSK